MAGAGQLDPVLPPICALLCSCACALAWQAPVHRIRPIRRDAAYAPLQDTTLECTFALEFGVSQRPLLLPLYYEFAFLLL